jgi:DNA polymerase III, alpha subunit
MAYLKANYFPLFMTTLLSSVTGNEGLTNDYVSEVRKNQIEILPPDINLSSDQYIYTDHAIHLPLLSIKSIGRLTVQKIIEERSNGPFKDYQEFKLRMKKEINDKNLEMLIHSGALDSFNLNRKTMSYNKQMDDAGYELYITDFKMKILDDYTFAEKAEFEKEALGVNLLYNPMMAYKNLIKEQNLKELSALESNSMIDALAIVKKSKK